MSLNKFAFRYRRNLPHIQLEGATLFVTFRLYGSVPLSLLEEWQRQKEESEKRLALIEDKIERSNQRYIEQKRQFGRLDSYLDQATTGPHWLKEPGKL